VIEKWVDFVIILNDLFHIIGSKVKVHEKQKPDKIDLE